MLLSILLLTALPQIQAQPGRFGLPACAGPDRELVHGTAFVVCYDSSAKIPVWAVHELTPERLAGSATRLHRFRPDPRITGPSALDADYRNSQYSRGHLVPAADLTWNENAMRESFYFTNVTPQNRSLNSGKWRVLESRIRLLAETSDSVVVFTGPVFCDTTEHIGAGQVAVPCKLYKVALSIRGGHMQMFAAVLPNSHNPREPLTTFAVPVAEVERVTRLDFFDRLPEQVQATLETRSEPLP